MSIIDFETLKTSKEIYLELINLYHFAFVKPNTFTVARLRFPVKLQTPRITQRSLKFSSDRKKKAGTRSIRSEVWYTQVRFSTRRAQSKKGIRKERKRERKKTPGHKRRLSARDSIGSSRRDVASRGCISQYYLQVRERIDPFPHSLPFSRFFHPARLLRSRRARFSLGRVAFPP